MSQFDENTFQDNQPQAEFSVDISEEQTSIKITIPSHWAKRISYVLLLFVTHLLAVALTTLGINPALLKMPESGTASPPQTHCLPR